MLSYTADLVPVAHLHIPAEARPERFVSAALPQRGPLSTSGVGAYPIGLRATFRPRTRLRPYVAGHTGALYFEDVVPDERGRRLNFTVGVGVGLQALLSRRVSLIVGYRYHHLSNGFRGSINPGLDANLLFFGVDTGL
jgi:opacity protein-like surface antigen